MQTQQLQIKSDFPRGAGRRPAGAEVSGFGRGNFVRYFFLGLASGRCQNWPTRGLPPKRPLLRAAVLMAVILLPCLAPAYEGMSVRPLQVVGRHLKDDTGKIVMLHGWMAPGGWYWNGRAFPDPVEFTPEECAPALQVYKLQVEVLTRTNAVWGKSHGSYHSFVRFGESPGWDAVNNLQNAERFDRYIENLLIPYVDYCATRGIYVCFIGGASTTTWMSAQHKANLIEYFTRLARHPGIKNRANVMFEICNEPVDIETELGNGQWGSSTPAHDRAIQRFMQDVADAIRGTGATNVIWIPGLIWQARLQNFATHPVEGFNIGYAGHWYPLGEDNPVNILNGWTNDWKKCSDVAPIIVTEGSWNTMAPDQGLRTGTTAGFGKTQRLIRDTAENISWMAGMNGEVIGNLDFPPGGTNYTFPEIACGQAAFDWFPSYTWCKPFSGASEVVLEQSLKIGDKLEVNSGQAGAQSFQYGPTPGGPNFEVTKLRLFVSKSPSAPTADLVVSLGTALQGGTIANGTVSITPVSVTDSSGGVTFTTVDIAFPTPVGPLAAGVTYYLNFSTASANSYFVQLSSLADSHTGTVDDLYPRGAAFAGVTDTGQDVRFLSFGGDLPTAPVPPTGLAATSAGGNQARLTWVDSRLATGYHVKRSTSSGGPYTTIITNTTRNNFTDVGLINGTTYYYVVTAVNPAGESANSAQVSATPQPKLTGLVIGTPGSWSGSGNTIDKVFDGNLGTYYDAVNATGDWAGVDVGSPRVVTQIKYAPRSGFAGRMVGGQFQGANVADFSSGVVTLFTVTTAPTADVLTTQAINNPNAFRYLRYLGPANGFCNVAEVEFWSGATGNPPPVAPSGLTGTMTNRQAVLSWNVAGGATTYSVKRSTTFGGPYLTITNVSGTSFTDPSLPTNTLYTSTYHYVVSALSNSGEGANSAAVSVTMPPTAPTRLTATGDNQHVALWWDFPGGADSYNVKRSATSGGPYTTIAANLVNNRFTDPELMSGTNYFYVVSAVNAGGESPNSAEATVNPPFPWMTREIGAGGGGASYSNGVFTVSGSGSDIWGTADAFRFAYVPVTGNCVIVARVVSLGHTDPWAKAGVMIRASLNANSANAFIAVTPSNGVTFQYRSSTDNNSGNNNTTGLNAPHWVRLVRSGNTFTAWRSANGVNWTQQGSSQTISMASPVYVGLAVTAHNPSALCTAVFDNVTLPGWPPPPAAPSGLVATAVATNQINLVWDAFPNATSYNVKRSTTNGGPYATIATGVTATNYPDTGLAGGTLYHYVVSAMVAGEESANSLPAAAATLSPTVGSLVHRYSFSENGGASVADSVGGPVWNGALPNGGAFAGGQLTLSNASSQYAQLPSGIVSTLSNFTIVAWVRLNSTANWTRIFDFGQNIATNMFLTPQNGANGRLRFAITTNGGGNEQQINCDATMSVGGWYQVAVTLNGSTGILYLNGAPVGTNNAMTLRPLSLGSTVNNYLGRSQYPDPYLDGVLDEFRIYNVELSAAEIAATYALGPETLLSLSSPSLSLAVGGANVTLTWPLANAGYAVQYRTNLVSGDWLNLTSPAPQIVGTNWQTTLPPVTNDAIFYRLVK